MGNRPKTDEKLTGAIYQIAPDMKANRVSRAFYVGEAGLKDVCESALR
jgi:hypothetical protein